MSIFDSRADRTDSRTAPSAFGAKASVSGGGGLPGPVISVLSSGTPNATDATITWTTDVLSNSIVEWGLTTTYAGASSPITDNTLVTSHSVQITGLTTATLYHYRVKSCIRGFCTYSVDGTFTTA